MADDEALFFLLIYFISIEGKNDMGQCHTQLQEVYDHHENSNEMNER